MSGGSVVTVVPLTDLLRRQRLALLLGAAMWFGPMLIGIVIGDRLDFGVEARKVEATPGLWWSIYSTNASVALLAFGGILTCGLATIAFTLVSGLLTGMGLAQATAIGGFGPMARHILPHAWLELPALGIAVAAGLVPLVTLGRHFLGRGGPRPSVRGIVNDAFGLLAVSLSLLLIAATIETWVST